ncbi:hypothetical protein QVD17_39223 [Tagetes erecta]|uniref:Peptidase C1A papain C-terminal domain-containing protein n=1 Tax=Tagetes erecta TaxID=13708 RepID=A0AAD8JPM8_TARER|nr:hypothetical protein QVD17_39223 [Tagetes erecta]
MVCCFICFHLAGWRYVHQGDLLLLNSKFCHGSFQLLNNDELGCSHAILIVGYGRKLDVNYWICKNNCGRTRERWVGIDPKRGLSFKDAFGLARRCCYPVMTGFNDNPKLSGLDTFEPLELSGLDTFDSLELLDFNTLS